MYTVAVALAGLELLNYINMFDYLFMRFFCDAHQLVTQHSLMNVAPFPDPRRGCSGEC